jgi:hypothetical protein
LASLRESEPLSDATLFASTAEPIHCFYGKFYRPFNSRTNIVKIAVHMPEKWPVKNVQACGTSGFFPLAALDIELAKSYQLLRHRNNRRDYTIFVRDDPMTQQQQ